MFKISLSVNQLLDTVYLSGDIVSSALIQKAMQRGTRLHQEYQSDYDSDSCEKPTKITLFQDDFEIELQGRIDIFEVIDGMPIITELKSTSSFLSYDKPSKRHLLQAVFYAYMVAMESDYEQAQVDIVYIDAQTKETKKFTKIYNIAELEHLVVTTITEYCQWLEFIKHLSVNRKLASENLKFPYEEYRKHQKVMMKQIYHNIEQSKQLFIHAPTGIGKTLASIVPAVKAMNHYTGKIFYLTAKNTGKESLRMAFNKLKVEKGNLKLVILNAKDHMCPNDVKKACDATTCKYAKGFFDDVLQLIKEIVTNNDTIDSQLIMDYGLEYQKCPYELSLMLAEYANIIGADYNYFFDPVVQLQRFFANGKSDDVLLIDEAHNIHKRVCDMFSITITPLHFQTLLENKKWKVKKTLVNDILTILLEIEKATEEVGFTSTKQYNEELIDKIIKLITHLENKIENKPEMMKEILFRDLFYHLRRFILIIEQFGSESRVYHRLTYEGFSYEISCLIPTRYIQDAFASIRSANMFSGTLLPIEFFNSMILNEDNPRNLLIPPIFPQENLKVWVCPTISTKYKTRQYTLPILADALQTFIDNTKGNTFIFFSSYIYMEQALEKIDCTNANLIVQKRDMTNIDRTEFFNEFKNKDKRVIAFGVLGGAFSEGVDYVGELLNNVAIVGIGLPTFNEEHKVLSSILENQFSKGYLYASLYPGLNKVLQAIGRVVRTETDKGQVLLIDERYIKHETKDVLFNYWRNYEVVKSIDELKRGLSKSKLN